MKRMLILVLWIISAARVYAGTDVEIVVNGQKYDSLQAYEDAKTKAAQKASLPAAGLDSRQEDYIRKEAKRLGIDVDMSKVKTLVVGQKNDSDDVRHKLYVLSVEKGVVDALRDFYLTRSQSGLPLSGAITLEQLQVAIREAVTTSKDPKLLISKPGKLRIMGLNP